MNETLRERMHLAMEAIVENKMLEWYKNTSKMMVYPRF